MDEETPAPGVEEAPNDSLSGDEEIPQPFDDDAQDGLKPTATKRSIDSHYPKKIGILHTISLTLNAGLMVYAHLGLSAVILSSQDPSTTASANIDIDAPTTTTAAPPNADDNDDGTIEGSGKCTPQDLELWIQSGGEVTRPEQSNYCSRQYNTAGCLLDSSCIETCFQEEYGYSEECATCFGEIPSCSVDNGCFLKCAVDSFSEECQECSKPCVEQSGVCTGLPLVIKESANEIAGKCNAQDVELWVATGGETVRPTQSNYCSREYNGGCLVDSECIEICFQKEYGYSEECSSCFGVIPMCSVSNGCTMKCASDSFSAECQQCNIPCFEELTICTGLVEKDANETISTQLNNNTDPSLPTNQSTGENTCNNFDLEAINQWYTVYNLTFVRSIQDAWSGDAKLLAVIIVLFSGIWPYLKNIILVIIWYLPTTEKRQTDTLVWLSRLSKYTLVDVFAVIGVLVGVQLQLNVGGTEAVTRAEPRFGIIAFFLATVWEFLQIELIKSMHERQLLRKSSNEARGDRLLFSKLWPTVFILVSSIVLYVAGSITEFVFFSSADVTGVCKKSYNVVTLGNALINELSMTDNSAKGQTWILYLSYVVLNLTFPILTHLLQIGFVVGWFRSKKLKRLTDLILAIWCFACIEVLLIGIFAVEYKFPNLIMKIAEQNAGFLDINSELGTGFYILIVYSVVAGFMQCSLKIRQNEPTACAIINGRK